MLFDVAIIGGGPAGCSAAVTAARMGMSVLLFERSQYPRHKVCGEFVSAEALGLLAELLRAQSTQLLAQAPRISQARIFLDDNVVSTPISPPAASISRFDLDIALWNACTANGVETHASSTVREVEGQGPFRILVGDHAFGAKAVINASGRWSTLTNRDIKTPSDSRCLGLKAHFEEPNPPDSVDLYFFQGGYCGVQPVSCDARGARINACALVQANAAKTIDDVLQQHPSLAQRSRNWMAAIQAVSTFPLLFHPAEPVHNSMLQTGDAAAFVDPFVGDGISLALRSGKLATDCLLPYLRGECSLSCACACYAREYGRRLGHVLQASSKLRRVLAWPVLIRRPLLSVASRAPFITAQLVRMTR